MSSIQNRYIDTRGLSGDPVPFTQAVINGLAQGGGLYVPEEIPQLNIDQIVAMANMPYAERAAAIYKLYGVDMPTGTIDQLMQGAYGAQWDTEEICPITSIDDTTHVLELWHGPTCAFKDMALQCLPRFFGESARLMRRWGKLKNEFLILVATSGDTGKAALEGFCDVPGVQIAVMYPHGGVSDIQYKQMATQKGSNVKVWAVQGNFDDCQTGAKKVFGDPVFAEKLAGDYKIALSSANSINWGRLLPQVVYYISAYGQLVKSGKITAGQPIDVCVPTGNFGNILAAYYAKRMGTPIERLLCASNQNRVLTDFINTGTYDISDREFILTPSPSMDILVSSNLERQLFELTGRNAEAIKGWMSDLSTKRCFRVDPETFAKVRETFVADSVSNEECLQTIARIHDRYGYLVDPHTAVAMEVADRLKGDNPVLVASTAHWAKFGENVYRALEGLEPGEALPADVAALTGCQLNELICETANRRLQMDKRAVGVPTYVPKPLAELDTAPIRFTQVIDHEVATIEDQVCVFLEELKAQA